jgi:type II secretion system protein H
MIRPRAIGRLRHAGFTLVELMIVMVIIAVMTALMIPEMKGSYEEALLKSNARKLSAAFNTAYSKAITTHQMHRVRIDPEQSNLIVEARTTEIDTPYLPLKEFERTDSQLHPNIRIRFHEPRQGFTGDPSQETSDRPDQASSQQPENVFVFDPDGTCKGKDVEMRDRMGFGLMIHLNQITSRVTFENMERIQP